MRTALLYGSAVRLLESVSEKTSVEAVRKGRVRRYGRSKKEKGRRQTEEPAATRSSLPQTQSEDPAGEEVGDHSSFKRKKLRCCGKHDAPPLASGAPWRISSHGEPRDSHRSRAGRALEEVKKGQIEGIVAKLKNSKYEPGKRSGAWRKYRSSRTTSSLADLPPAARSNRSWSGTLMASTSCLRQRSRPGSTSSAASFSSNCFPNSPKRTCPFAKPA